MSCANPLALSFLLAVSVSPLADAAESSIPGPISAELIRVVDGDTLLVSAAPWPNHQITTYVRLRGINAPELKSKCTAQRQAAIDAQNALVAMVAGDRVMLEDISGDKYYGRVLARVRLPDGRDAASELLAEGLVEEYDGGRKPLKRCRS